jgi:hypothetical protein
MAELCSLAGHIAMEALEDGLEPDITEAFEQALMQKLQSGTYTKNDLTSVWAMLMLGSRVIRKVCLESPDFSFEAMPPEATQQAPTGDSLSA